MRIISQNGSVDINYDKFYVVIEDGEDEFELVAYDEVGSDMGLRLGTFKTKEKVLGVMVKIRNAYAFDRICVIPDEEL